MKHQRDDRGGRMNSEQNTRTAEGLRRIFLPGVLHGGQNSNSQEYYRTDPDPLAGYVHHVRAPNKPTKHDHEPNGINPKRHGCLLWIIVVTTQPPECRQAVCATIPCSTEFGLPSRLAYRSARPAAKAVSGTIMGRRNSYRRLLSLLLRRSIWMPTWSTPITRMMVPTPRIGSVPGLRNRLKCTEDPAGTVGCTFTSMPFKLTSSVSPSKWLPSN